MLTSAIMQVMDLSEIVIFVNTNNSVPVLENTLSGKKEYTFSPWIYEEVLLTELLRGKNGLSIDYQLLMKEWNIKKNRILKLRMNFLRII